MKQNLLKLMTLVALVVLANTTFAAAGDTYEPFQGTSKTYGIAGLTNGDTYELWITTTTATPTTGTPTDAVDDAEVVLSAASNSGTVNGTNAYASGTVASNAAGVTVAWGDDADSGNAFDYYLWVRIASGDGCSNFRYKGINVYSYFVDFTIAALGQNDDHATDDGTIDCQVLIGNSYDMDGTPTDGTIAHYYTVTRTPNVSVDSDWDVTLTLTGDLANQSLAYGTSAGTYGTAITDAVSFTVASGTNTIYVRVVGDAHTSADLVASMEITAAQDDANHTDDDDGDATITAQNTAVNNFYRLPAIGAFN